MSKNNTEDILSKEATFELSNHHFYEETSCFASIRNENKNITKISPDRIYICMQCVHCVDLCPNHAIQVESLYKEE